MTTSLQILTATCALFLQYCSVKYVLHISWSSFRFAHVKVSVETGPHMTEQSWHAKEVAIREESKPRKWSSRDERIRLFYIKVSSDQKSA